MQLILSQFKNRLRPAYTAHPDFHTMQSVLIDYTTHTGRGGKKKKKGNRDRVGIATVTRVVFPLYPRVSNILHCLLLGLSHTHTQQLSCHKKRPSGLASTLPSPFLPALPSCTGSLRVI